MELFLRDNDTSEWIELEGGVRLKVGYPSPAQEMQLAAKLGEMRWTDPSEDTKRTNILIQYYGMIIKFCVKDWDGIKNAKTGEAIPCRMNPAGDELDPGLWAALIANPGIAEYWGGTIKKQIDFNETDKKK